MKDFCNAAERDCIRLIVAQDLKESGIDVETNLGGGGGGGASNNSLYRASANTSINSKNSASGNLINTISGNSSCSSSSQPSSSQSYFSSSSSSKHHSSKNNTTTAGNTSNLVIFTAGMVGNESATAANLHHHSLHHDSNSSSTTCSNRIFGLHLTQLEMVTLSVNDQLLSVPSFLKQAIEHLNEHVNVEGIFRRAGTQSRLKEIKRQAEEGIFNFSQYPVVDVASLVKSFFRDLPECLLSFALYANFIQAVKLETEKSQIDSVLNLCLQLPDPNLHVLIYLMNFLNNVTAHESSNKMSSYNLAVCFAPNIIYAKVNKINGTKLQLEEEQSVVKILIENSAQIGKVSDSVYERSLMLNSLCCPTTMMMMNGGAGSSLVGGGSSLANSSNLGNTVGDSSMGMSRSNNNAIGSVGVGIGAGSAASMNNDLMFIYDNDLPENCSFAHAGQSAGSTSLSSYCGSSTSKKEKKKRRSSSLKELMNTIQNSISKFRRRSASEKNDKTTCSIITCTSMNNGISSVGLTFADTSCTGSIRGGGGGGTNASSSAFILMDEKEGSQSMMNATPYCGGGGASGHHGGSKQLPIINTPICANMYATPRINKRNAEESLQSTTKK